MSFVVLKTFRSESSLEKVLHKTAAKNFRQDNFPGNPLLGSNHLPF